MLFSHFHNTTTKIRILNYLSILLLDSGSDILRIRRWTGSLLKRECKMVSSVCGRREHYGRLNRPWRIQSVDKNEHRKVTAERNWGRLQRRLFI